MRTYSPLAVAAAVTAGFALPPTATAQLVADPAGDFLAGYVGPRNGDMDVLAAGVLFDGSTYRFTSQSAGAIGTTPGALFVWGVDRGRGTARFGTLAPGVLFDAVVVVNPGGPTTVVDLTNGASTTLPVGAVSFGGAELSAIVPASLLPTLAGGFAQSRYTANLWPRVGAGVTAISDFAPDNSNLAVTATPEPSTVAMVAGGVLALAAAARRRRTA